MKRMAALAALLLAPAGAQAQALECRITGTIARPHAELPSADQPQRVVPIGGYTLALIWSPQHCRGQTSAADRFQCTSGNRFGFVLHGLWPDGVGKEWPQYCRPATLLRTATIRRNLCVTPSPQLMQHEWAKHGTCMSGIDPDSYFARSTGLFGALSFPDMDALSRRPALNAGTLAAAIAGANRGLRADGMRITTDRRGWLEEVWLCLDTAFRPRRCPAHQGGVADAARVSIWRGHR